MSDANAATFDLNHDFGGPGKLRITQIPNPPAWRLLLFCSADWQAHRRTNVYAWNSTGLAADGSWNTAMTVVAGEYHLVAVRYGAHTVCFPNLKVRV